MQWLPQQKLEFFERFILKRNLFNIDFKKVMKLLPQFRDEIAERFSEYQDVKDFVNGEDFDENLIVLNKKKDQKLICFGDHESLM